MACPQGKKITENLCSSPQAIINGLSLNQPESRLGKNPKLSFGTLRQGNPFCTCNQRWKLQKNSNMEVIT